MGNHFVMSFRFDKVTAFDFGFTATGNERATNPKDGSVWIKKNLYDFGWGPENGYYKYPLPDFPQLFNLVLAGTDQSDIYGAAAIISEQYPEELLCQCEIVASDLKKRAEFKTLSEIFKLDSAVNRCPVQGKSFIEVQKDFERWKKLSEIAKKL